MFNDFTIFLWLLKLGALLNLYFLANTYALSSGSTDAHIVIPAQVFFAVSAYRCLFPAWYKDNIVFHNSPFSSIFLTRLLATFAEVAFIYQFSHVIRLLNVDHVGWVDVLSWLMVVQVVISQGFVWGAILTGRLALYYYEELGWAIIFAANTIASAYLYATVDALGGGEFLIQLNLLFGLVYLPWQFNHLRVLRLDARRGGEAIESGTGVTRTLLAKGLRQSIHVRNRTTDAEAWGRLVGLTWMASYWATVIPIWVNHVVGVFSAR
ncbi:MAG: hypothetical protein JRE71_20905 [Deltaproteobacteria bacterium]|nr:hypothetical protein [Deltaproteobacteria bacterium]